LEVFAMFEQLRAQRAHGAVLFDAVPVRDDDRCGQSQPARGECHGLPVVAPRGRDHAARLGLPGGEASQVVHQPADLEGAERGVVVMFHPEFAARAGVEERPTELRRGRHHALDLGGDGFDLGESGQTRHVVSV
jgi:hypothetical protein